MTKSKHKAKNSWKEAANSNSVRDNRSSGPYRAVKVGTAETVGTSETTNNKTIEQDSDPQSHRNEGLSKSLPPKEQRKYSRRKLESNWNRYDEGLIYHDVIEEMADVCSLLLPLSSDHLIIPLEEPEIDDASVPPTKERSGADFQTLIAQAGTGTSQFRFHDELEWDSTQDASGQTPSETDDLGLGLDLVVLGASLRSIPLTVKLGLSDLLKPPFQDKHETFGEYLELQKHKEVAYLRQQEEMTGKKENCIETVTELPEWTFNGRDDLASSVNKLFSKMNRLNEETSLTKGENNSNASISVDTEPQKSPLNATGNIMNQAQSTGKYQSSLVCNVRNEDLRSVSTASNDTHVEDLSKNNILDDDEELDELLSITAPVKTSHPISGKNKSNSRNSVSMENSQERVVELPSESITSNSPSKLELESVVVSSNTESKVEDLEDWLDSILD